MVQDVELDVATAYFAIHVPADFKKEPLNVALGIYVVLQNQVVLSL